MLLSASCDKIISASFGGPAGQYDDNAGREMFKEALAEGTMEGFFQLIEQFSTQEEPAYCGLASVAMTLNTLKIDPVIAFTPILIHVGT